MAEIPFYATPGGLKPMVSPNPGMKSIIDQFLYAKSPTEELFKKEVAEKFPVKKEPEKLLHSLEWIINGGEPDFSVECIHDGGACAAFSKLNDLDFYDFVDAAHGPDKLRPGNILLWKDTYGSIVWEYEDAPVTANVAKEAFDLGFSAGKAEALSAPQQALDAAFGVKPKEPEPEKASKPLPPDLLNELLDGATQNLIDNPGANLSSEGPDFNNKVSKFQWDDEPWKQVKLKLTSEALKQLKAGEITVDQLKSTYEISPNQMKIVDEFLWKKANGEYKPFKPLKLSAVKLTPNGSIHEYDPPVYFDGKAAEAANSAINAAINWTDIEPVPEGDYPSPSKVKIPSEATQQPWEKASAKQILDQIMKVKNAMEGIGPAVDTVESNVGVFTKMTVDKKTGTQAGFPALVPPKKGVKKNVNKKWAGLYADPVDTDQINNDMAGRIQHSTPKKKSKLGFGHSYTESGDEYDDADELLEDPIGMQPTPDEDFSW